MKVKSYHRRSRTKSFEIENKRTVYFLLALLLSFTAFVIYQIGGINNFIQAIF